MSSPLTCLSCNRTMFTPSGFSPPSAGSLMVHSYTQCTECHAKGLPDLVPPPDPNAKTYSIPYTPMVLETFEIKGPVTTFAQMADEAEKSGKRMDIDCAFCGVKLFVWPVNKCENGHPASMLAQMMERARQRAKKEIEFHKDDLFTFEDKDENP